VRERERERKREREIVRDEKIGRKELGERGWGKGRGEIEKM